LQIIIPHRKKDVQEDVIVIIVSMKGQCQISLVSRSGVSDLLPMPKRLANGNYPALETFRVSIARDIVISRKAAGLSQAELARRAGIRAETLNRIEKAKVMPDEATAGKIEKALAKK
jgi:DNA-binding XRE family transcriptional regulator